MGNVAISSTESNLSDSEYDSCDLKDVKLTPSLSTFLQKGQENVRPSYLKHDEKRKYDDYQSVTLGDEYVARAAANVHHYKPTFQHDVCPEHSCPSFSSRDDVQTVFQSGCLLPEFPELRDSYDQFCTTLSEHSSRDELDAKRSIKDFDICASKDLREVRLGCSRYCSDDTLDSSHLCKRRKKTILEEASDAHEKYQRWSMPEFTKMWYETADSDTESVVNDQKEAGIGNPRPSTSNQSCEIISSNGVIETTFNSGHDANPVTRRIPNIVCTEFERQTPKTKEYEVRGSFSCPAIVSVKSTPNFSPCTYDNSGNLDSSESSSSPSYTRALACTTTKKGQCTYWHESHFEDGLSYDQNCNERGASLSDAICPNCEVSVCTSDSGYSGMSNGTRDSPDGEEHEIHEIYNTLEDKPTYLLTKPEHFRALKDLQEKLGYPTNDESEEDEGVASEDAQLDIKLHPLSSSISSIPRKRQCLSFPDAILENETSGGNTDERCAQLMEEFRNNKASHHRTTPVSLYRTYAV